MVRAMPSECLCCKPKLIVNHKLFPVTEVYVQKEFLFATRTNRVSSCPRDCVSVYRVVISLISKNIGVHT
jgi:hypothetical protein